MHVSAHHWPALALAAVLTLAGCAGSTEEPGQAAGAGSTGAVEVDVHIENGEVTPSGERVDVEVGQKVRFVVDSDAADEIHVHSVPEHTFSFGPGTQDRQFAFTVRQPGVVEAELHELGDVLVTIAARP
jgi:plastocyanin